jgi:hypothetical protein
MADNVIDGKRPIVLESSCGNTMIEHFAGTLALGRAIDKEGSVLFA